MSEDKDNRRKKQKSPPPTSHDRDDPETAAPPHATTETTHDFQDNRPGQLEPEEDVDKPVVLEFALDFTSHPPHFHPVSSHHSQDMSYDHLHDPINYPTSVTMPPDHRTILPPYNYAGSSYGSYSEPYYNEAFDVATQMEVGAYHDQYHGREGANTPGPVDDLQQIALLRSSSHEITGIDDETARHRTGVPSSNDHLSSESPNEGQPVPSEEIFRGSLLNVDYHYHSSSAYPYPYPMHPTTYQYNIPNTPIQTHQYPPHASPPSLPGPYHLPNTPIQTQRYPFAGPVEGIMPGYDDDDDSSLDRKPAALPRPTRGRSQRGGTIPPKGTKTEKISPKKKAKPKKRQTRASRPSYGSSSSSSPPSGGVSGPEYSFIRPDQEELNEAKTDRAREALMNWHERLRDLYKFKKEKGHTKVPQKYNQNRELGVWVNKQRMEKKAYDEGRKSSMTQRKIEKLEQAGFEWGKPKGVSAWEEKYNELQEYMRDKGDANVPTKYVENRALGRWVSTQRNMYKKYHGGASFNSLLPSEIERRIELLNQLGFIWNMAPTSGSDDPDQKESQHDDADEEAR